MHYFFGKRIHFKGENNLYQVELIYFNVMQTVLILLISGNIC